MPVRIENSGDIEAVSQSGDIAAGDTANVVFRTWDETKPPYTLKVRAPDGKVILDRVLRELPTGRPQSAPAVSFLTAVSGAYKIEISELYGGAAGTATLHVP